MQDPEHYTVGWICALSTEYTAARQFLDKNHGRPHRLAPNDSNQYTLGTMAGHSVVIALLPDGEYGTSSAANVAAHMRNSFRNIDFGLMVGIGGGAPTAKDDIRLGDVVVSSPQNGLGGVYQYDFGKTIQERAFKPTGFLNQPPKAVRAGVSGLRALYEEQGHAFATSIEDIFQKCPMLRGKYARPNQETDCLYKSEVVHPHDRMGDCKELCGTLATHIVERRPRNNYDLDPTIHYGIIASGNQLMKDATIRDALAHEQDVLCFEMEAAGLMNNFPCLVVRGICDYSDSHKNKDWQGYAAMTAAAYTKDLLKIVPPKISAATSLADTFADDERRARQYLEHQQWSEGVGLLQRVVDQQEVILGHDHTNRFNNLCTLQWGYWMSGDKWKAERIARQALEICERNHPEPDHPLTLNLMQKIADNLLHQGRQVERNIILEEIARRKQRHDDGDH